MTDTYSEMACVNVEVQLNGKHCTDDHRVRAYANTVQYDQIYRTDSAGDDGHTNARMEIVDWCHYPTYGDLKNENADGIMMAAPRYASHEHTLEYKNNVRELWMHLVFRFRACSITFASPVEWEGCKRIYDWNGNAQQR